MKKNKSILDKKCKVVNNYEKIKILFVCASMKVGGAEKSLVNLLNLIDYSKYDVDLLLLQKQGAFLKQIQNSENT